MEIEHLDNFLGEYIDTERIRKGVSKGKLAKIVNSNEYKIRRIIKGESPLELRLAFDISKALNISFDLLRIQSEKRKEIIKNRMKYRAKILVDKNLRRKQTLKDKNL